MLGHAIGFVFAAIVLSTTVVAFPLLLDRDVGAYEAIHTSVRAVLANPIPMAAWGLIVAVLLIIGSLPVFAGLAIVLPMLGHATWHLYRKVVEPPPSARTRRARTAGRQCRVRRRKAKAPSRAVRDGALLLLGTELNALSRYGPAPKNVSRVSSV